jgi:serine/threonine-protein kinase HipA
MTIAKVNLWGMFVGGVYWDAARGHAFFEFDAEFLRRGLDLAPLTMPVAGAAAGRATYAFPRLNQETFRGLPGLLADSLPDRFGNALIDARLAREGRTPESFNPVDRLCYTGSRGMGALEYEPSTGPAEGASEPVAIDHLVRLAGEALSARKKLRANLHDDPEHGLREILRVGTSAGGARAKAVIAYNDATGEVRSGQIDGAEGFAHWIIKFDGVTNALLGDPAGYERIEYAYSLMARACGIEMTECRLLEEKGRAHFLTRRFDRPRGEKLHMQTLCAIGHYDYNLARGYSYEQAFEVLRRLRAPYGDSEQLFRRMAFNVVARNQDDHTKNIAFLMDPMGEWRLSPAYDVTYACDPANPWMKAHQMTVNGKFEEITSADLLSVAQGMNVRKAREILQEVRDGVAQWPRHAREAGINQARIDEVRKRHLLRL